MAMDKMFCRYIEKFGYFQKRSMFGGIGLFVENAMYALIVDEKFFIRGGEGLDECFVRLNCEKFLHKKRQSTVLVNYYDVTALFYSGSGELDHLIERSILCAIEHKKYKNSLESRRLRDLPNLHLTLERMLKRSGIADVTTFYDYGAEKTFMLVKDKHGPHVNEQLLWKFAGAIDGVHWMLLPESRKKGLLEACKLK